mmetsp:Transcript_8317/g.23888  ORF Transcript_8317/g.23888 Transcript_8317/m.23888 type:complete len:256 (+) Transcript_8317:1592-2359(+)
MFRIQFHALLQILRGPSFGVCGLRGRQRQRARNFGATYRQTRLGRADCLRESVQRSAKLRRDVGARASSFMRRLTLIAMCGMRRPAARQKARDLLHLAVPRHSDALDHGPALPPLIIGLAQELLDPLTKHVELPIHVSDQAPKVCGAVAGEAVALIAPHGGSQCAVVFSRRPPRRPLGRARVALRPRVQARRQLRRQPPLLVRASLRRARAQLRLRESRGVLWDTRLRADKGWRDEWPRLAFGAGHVWQSEAKLG